MAALNGTSSKLRRVKGICTAAFITAALLGCQSSPEVMNPAIISGGGSFRAGRPAWIDRYPVDADYYIGVGSSNTGEKTADMNAAKAQAMVNLASSISTQIQSEQLVTSRDDSNGEAYQSAEQVIRETVDQNIREVEVADSYHSDSEGYWFYVRLNKAVWEAIQREEMDRLARRVAAMVEPELSDPEASIASRLATLWKGWQLLYESPYAPLIETELAGREGLLIDLIEREMVRHVDSLSLRFKPGVLISRPGGAAALEAAVVTNMDLHPGVMNVVISGEDEPAAVFGEFTTGEDGVYTGELAVLGAEPGKMRLIGWIDLPALGLDLEKIPKQFFVPERELTLNIKLVSAVLSVTSVIGEETGPAQNLYGSLAGFLSSKLPVELKPDGDADYEISVAVNFREAPPNKYDLIITYSKALISINRGGGAVYTCETPEFKDGGLSSAQARTRSFSKLMEGLEEIPELISELGKAFSL